MRTDAIDLIGQRFGQLIPYVYYPGITSPGTRFGKWRCLCDCGTIVDVASGELRQHKTTSCGCTRLQKIGAHKRRHGYHGTPTYRSWEGMRQRCANTGNPRFNDYGGRGIVVCERWQSFENFLADMGECPPCLSIDRINNDGNYEPSNCRWATCSEQALNRRPKRALLAKLRGKG